MARPDPALRRPGHHVLACLAQLVGGPVLPRLRRPVRLDVGLPLARVRARHGVQDPLDRRGAVPARLVHDHAGPDHLAVEPHQAPHRHAGRRAGPEIAVMRPARLAKLLVNYFGLVDVPTAFWLMFRHAPGALTADEADYTPSAARNP